MLNKNTDGAPFFIPREILLVIVLYGFLLWPFLIRLDRAPLHIDENYWIRSSRFYKLFLIDQDWKNTEWRSPEAFENPPMGKYIIGFALTVSGDKNTISEANELQPWNFRKDGAWNEKQRAIPPKNLLHAARSPMAFFGSLACLLVYGIARIAWGTVAGIIAALFLAHSPAILMAGTHALTNSPLIFFMGLQTLLTMLVYRQIQKNNAGWSFVCSGLAGINAGFAAATKLNGALSAFVSISFLLWVITIKWIFRVRPEAGFLNCVKRFRKDRQIRIIMGSLAILCLLAISAFVFVNPALHKSPIAGIIKSIEHWKDLIALQQKIIGPAIETPAEKIIFVFRNAFCLWPCDFPETRSFTPLNFMMFVAGLIILCVKERRWIIKNHAPSFNSIIAAWVFVTFLGTTLWIPLDWPRYYLPLFPGVAVLMAYGITGLIAAILPELALIIHTLLD